MGVRRCPAVDYPAAVQRLLDAAGAAVGDRVRAVKPAVAVVGNEGIPLRDMWELEKEL